MIKVAKFGGSSVANATQFEKVKAIADNDPSRKYIVTSACGKESKEDHKVTDLLYLCQAHIKYGVSYEDIFSLVEKKYLDIRDKLKLSFDMEAEFKQIRELIEKGVSTDYLVSRGEYLTARLLAEYLDAKFVDATELIVFRYDGSFDMEKIMENIRKYTVTEERVVIPGFYGVLPNGVIKLMKRGGSDITGALIANAADADVYENWTDVSGFLVADPRIIDSPLRIPRITYSELREMSYMGANVLQDEAIFPVREKNIPINIRNTNEPGNPGTVILEDCTEIDLKEPPHVVTGITGQKDFTVITLTKAHCCMEVGFLRRILSVFEKYKVSIESIPSTVDTTSVIVRSEAVKQNLYEIVAELKKEVKPDDLVIDDRLALVAIVGRGMKRRVGMSGRLLSEFGHHQVNIRTIIQTSDELSIVVGVADDDFEKAIHVVYERFIKEEQKVR